MNIAKNNIFKVLILTYVGGIILGIIGYFILDVSSINNNISNYFNMFNDNFDYLNGVLNTMNYNFSYAFFIWISGILLIGIFFSPLVIVLRGISVGITFISIISLFKFKGFLIFIILFILNILINDFIYILLGYYSMKLSLREINIIKNNKAINFKSFYKNNFYRFILLLIVLFLSCLFEIYVVSNILKYIIT